MYGHFARTPALAGIPPHNVALGSAARVESVVEHTLLHVAVAALDIVVLDLLAAVYIVVTLPRSLMASLFFVPYALWLALATYLNIYIWIYN